MTKKVSIIMGIYNCEATLDDALQSIKDQTYENWQLVLCDDGSTDSTYLIAKSFAQRNTDRVILLQNPENMGLNRTLNRCLEAADGDYIARQDGDDASAPQRLEQEVALLEQKPEYVIVSTAMTLFDDRGDWGSIQRLEQPKPQDLIRGTPFAHAPSMMRAEAIRAVGGYSEAAKFTRVEDYHLWYKMYREGFRGYNIPDALYRCRDDRDAQDRRKFKYRWNECYVRWLIYREFGYGIRQLPQVVKPLLVGLLPSSIYRRLHRQRLERQGGGRGT